ncbi:MAG: transposase, partial [Endozoicomonadaceae bacterium]|nr:transposase [Endozoicomonadaceae bacterium]
MGNITNNYEKNQCHRWKNDRNVISAILWILYTGSPWRDIPSKFCP